MKIKHLKAKLLTAALSLVLAVAMMGGATFAWMTISTNPEITGLEATVVVNENLEIALCDASKTTPANSLVGDSIFSGEVASETDTNGAFVKYTQANLKGDYTWGNLVSLDHGDAATAFNTLNKTLRPATYDETNGFQNPVYGDDGRITKLEAITMDSTFGMGNLKGTTDGKIYGYFVDFWVRSNVAGDLALTTATKRSSDGKLGGGSLFTTTDSELKTNLKIAFEDITSGATGKGLVAATSDDAGALTCANICTLEANTAKLIRVYVYLYGGTASLGDGQTNAHASVDLGEIDATLNLQFAVSGVDHSMDGQN